jgi:Cft2 family RNA processing exonuclease
VSALTQQDSSTTSASLCFHAHKEKFCALQKLYYFNIRIVTFQTTAYICTCTSRGVTAFQVALSAEEVIKHQMRWENDHK